MGRPIRKCVICQKRRAKQELLRIVRTPRGSIAFDPAQKREGRGLYICPSLPCLQKARSKDIIGHSFQRQVPISIYSQLAEYVQEAECNSLEVLLGFAARSQRLLKGITVVEQGVKKGKVKLVVFADETKESTAKRIKNVSRQGEIPLILYNGKKPLEKVVGKYNCRCVGITDSGFVRAILNSVHFAED